MIVRGYTPLTLTLKLLLGHKMLFIRNILTKWIPGEDKKEKKRLLYISSRRKCF